MRAIDERRREPRGRVHWQVERDERRRAQLLLRDGRPRRIDALHVDPRGAKPCGGGRQAKRLAAKVVGGDQERPHLPIVWKRTIL
jgi:hypothetical protein